jgi:hypothetical protein
VCTRYRIYRNVIRNTARCTATYTIPKQYGEHDDANGAAEDHPDWHGVN